jgi:lipoate-protein ligase A
MPDSTTPKPVSVRLIIHNECNPVWNMAVDEALFDALVDGVGEPTLRLYRWDKPAITIGRFQSVERDLQADILSQLEIPILRRPTGGRAVIHGGDQTFSLTLPPQLTGEWGTSVQRSYRHIAEGIVAGLRFLHQDAILDENCVKASRSGDCFATQTVADLRVGQHKLVGSAQLRQRGYLLQQTSIAYREPEVLPEQTFRHPGPPREYPLSEAVEEDVENALVTGFSQALGWRLIENELTQYELERAASIIAEGRIQVDMRSAL